MKNIDSKNWIPDPSNSAGRQVGNDNFKGKRIRVAVGMSGGVDSSVAAKILLDQGYEVVGFMMKLWSGSDAKCTRDNACCDIDGLQDAKRIAAILDIPFYVVDVRKKFKEEVADYFIEEYKNLRTPNPCVKCNEKIKFGWLLDFAKKTGCDFLATGHYARIASESPITKKQSPVNNQLSNSDVQNNIYCHPALDAGSRNYCIDSGSRATGRNDNIKYHLLKGKDETKDQSYFLYRLNQSQLSKIIFPVGKYSKKEVRAMAKKWNLPVHEKKESQEICFIQEKDYREFLKKNIPAGFFKSGDIVDLSGNVIGKHDGLINYTIGQRKGIEQDRNVETVIPAKAGIQKNIILDPREQACPPAGRPEDDKVGNDKSPLYVIGFDIKRNQLIVGEDKDIYKSEMIIKDVHFTNLKFKIQNLKLRNLTIKIRYRHPAVNCRIIPDRHPEFISGSQKDGMLRRIQIPKQVRDDARASVQHDKMLAIRFNQPQRAITPGQSAVFYDGEEVLGGGIIEA